MDELNNSLKKFVTTLVLIISLCLSSCTNIGYTLGEETNFLGSILSVIYGADKDPDAIKDDIWIIDVED